MTRLITIRNSGADILQDLNYIYDPVGNIVEMTDDAQETIFFNNAQVTPDTKYEYDALYRLLNATGRQMVGLTTPSHADVPIQSLPDATATALEPYTQSYQYDELGNILQMAHAANSGNWNRYYHYTSGFTNNYLLSTSPDNVQPGTDHYIYDAHGNMTKMSHLSGMGWDYADRLQSAVNGTQTSHYTYDAGGNRVRKVVDKGGGLIHERIYIGDWEVYREIQSSTVQLERETLHISDDTGRIALTDTLTIDSGSPVGSPTPNIRYQMSNHLGSATLELDNAAATISYEEYHPFGSTSYRSGSSSAEVSLKRYRYVGKERDDETGLYYYGARYYAAWLARFVSVDPLKDDYPQLSPFNYAGNRPITFKDIDGQQSPGDENRNPFQITKDDDGNITSVTITTEKDIVKDDNGNIISGTITETTFESFDDLINSEVFKSLDESVKDQLIEGLVGDGSDISRLAISSLLNASDANARLTKYLPELPKITKEGLELIDAAEANNDLNTAQKAGTNASKKRNQLREKIQGKLSPAGKASSSAIEQTRNTDEIRANKAKQGYKDFDLEREVAKSAGKSSGQDAKGLKRATNLKNLSRAGRVLGALGTILGGILSVSRYRNAPDDQKGVVAAEEIGGLALGTLGGIAGGILGAGVAAFIGGALGLAAAPVLLTIGLGIGLGYLLGKVAGNIGEKWGRDIYFSL